MSLLLVLQVPVIQFVLETSQVRPSHPTDGVTEFHVLFLSLDLSQNDSFLTVFLTEGKIVFHVSILSLVPLGKGYVSCRLSYGQTYTYRSRHTYYVTVLAFVCPYVRMTLAIICYHQDCIPIKMLIMLDQHFFNNDQQIDESFLINIYLYSISS